MVEEGIASMTNRLPDDDHVPSPRRAPELSEPNRLRLMGVHTLEKAMDLRCGSMATHCSRTAFLATALAREIGWSNDAVWDMYYAALLHEIGALVLPDTILFTPHDLSDDELAYFRTHSALGADLVHDWLTNEQCSWIRGHHEALDGSGYPDGLAGAEMSEGMCVLSIADAWEERSTPWLVSDLARIATVPDVSAATDACREGRGTLFRPDLVDALEVVVARHGTQVRGERLRQA
jgi:HD-GYP domain-containing protein (c-di-GMP phosphodiesterase class II)